MGDMTIKEIIEEGRQVSLRGWFKRHLYWGGEHSWNMMKYDVELAPEGGYHRAGSTPTVIVVGEHI